MNCDLYIALINGHLDGINTAAEEADLQAHLNTCESCRSLLSVLTANDMLLKESVAEPPADLTANIMQKVRNHPKRNSKKAFYTSLAATGLAAAAMLGIYLSADNVQPPTNEGISVVSETDSASYGSVAKRSAPTAIGVLVLNGRSDALEFDGEAIDAKNLPAAVTRAGYPITGAEKEAFNISLDELKRIHELYGGSLYNPEANTSGILIFVD